jgi:hypothetical protein
LFNFVSAVLVTFSCLGYGAKTEEGTEREWNDSMMLCEHDISVIARRRQLSFRLASLKQEDNFKLQRIYKAVEI